MCPRLDETIVDNTENYNICTSNHSQPKGKNRVIFQEQEKIASLSTGSKEKWREILTEAINPFEHSLIWLRCNNKRQKGLRDLPLYSNKCHPPPPPLISR